MLKRKLRRDLLVIMHLALFIGFITSFFPKYFAYIFPQVLMIPSMIDYRDMPNALEFFADWLFYSVAMFAVGLMFFLLWNFKNRFNISD